MSDPLWGGKQSAAGYAAFYPTQDTDHVLDVLADLLTDCFDQSMLVLYRLICLLLMKAAKIPLFTRLMH